MSKKNFITLLFFLTVNTSYFWLTEIGLLGITSFAFLLLLFVIYFILAIELVGQLFLIVNERFTDRQRLARATFSTTILTLIYFFPAGFINFQKFRIFENLEKKTCLLRSAKALLVL